MFHRIGRRILSARNSSNRARALQRGVPPVFADADTDDLMAKFDAQRTAGGWHACYLCGTMIESDAGWELEHVHPLVLGGVHQTQNLQVACPRCNAIKGTLTLEDLLGPVEAERWRQLGWPPPYEALATRPVAELWKMSPAVARKFARTPREVPSVAMRWGSSFDSLDARIARVLPRQPNPWLAMTTGQLAGCPLLPGKGPLDQAWYVAMGLYTCKSNGQYLDVRYEPSRLVIPTRAAPADGSVLAERAFRLPFNVEPLG